MERQELIDYFMLNYECTWRTWTDDLFTFTLDNEDEVHFLEDEVMYSVAWQGILYSHSYPVTVESILNKFGH